MSEASSSSPISAGDYAPSPNTCSMALTRANQLRVQALLRQLLVADGDHPKRLDTLRVLRRTIREFDYNLSWLTQVDFLETIERLLGEENQSTDSSEDNWRLINDSTQLLIESIPRLPHQIDAQTISQILSSVIQNLGHPRSEVRRASLLLLNMYINERPNHFQEMLKLFIDYGLANHRNAQAQKGAILSLPLLMTEQVVEGEDLLPLMRCLSELLVEANAQLFYSLYLALQRLHMTVGEQQFANYLRQCDPEATLLYKQAQSRQNSLVGPINQQVAIVQHSQQHCSSDRRPSRRGSMKHSDGPPHRHSLEQANTTSEPKQVTFENGSNREASQKAESPICQTSASSSSSAGSLAADTDNDIVTDLDSNAAEPERGGGGATDASSTASSPSVRPWTSTAHTKVTPTSSRKQSSVSSTCSSEANLVDPAHYMTKAALSGRPLSGYERIHHVDHSNTGLAINDLATSCSPTMELGPAAQNELKFGIFPRMLVSGALNARYLDRIEALQEMMCIVRDSPINHLAILMTYFDSFLEQFLAPLMEPNTDYKVELIAIDMIETIVIKTKVSTMHYVRPMINLLVKTLGDSRTSIFRENSIRVIHKMMAFLPPQHVIDALFEHKHSKSVTVREECVNRVTGAVLEYDRNEFNLTKLCYHVLPMLADERASVRLAALECIAALAQALGQERIGSLLTAAEAVQTGCDYDGLLEAIHARLRRRALPRCNPDGSIRHVIKPFLNLANANYHQEHKAADVRWVLEAPSSHQQVTVTASGCLQHQAMFEGHSPALGGLEHAHAHRPGAYSPPDLAQQRRCSVSLGQLAGCAEQNQHQHHHRQQHRCPPARVTHLTNLTISNIRTRPAYETAALVSHELARAAPEEARRGNNAARTQPEIGRRRSGPIDGNEPCNCVRPDQSTSDRHQRFESAHSEREAAQASRNPDRPISNLSEISSRQSSAKLGSSNPDRSPRTSPQDEHVGATGGQKSGGLSNPTNQIKAGAQNPKIARQSRDKQMVAASGFFRRSNSQESSSSTDTNKVLFRYYLGKFKQSLTEPGNGSVMHSVGRIPTGANPMSQNRNSDRSNERSVLFESQPSGQNGRQASGDPLGDSSGSESPLTVMEARKEIDEEQEALSRKRAGQNTRNHQRQRINSRLASQEEKAPSDDRTSAGNPFHRKSVTNMQNDAEIANLPSRRQSVVSLSRTSVDQNPSALAHQDRRRESVVAQAHKDEPLTRDSPQTDTGDRSDMDRSDGHSRLRSESDRPGGSEDQPVRSGGQNSKRGLVRQSASLAVDAFAGSETPARASVSSSASSNNVILEPERPNPATKERRHSRRDSVAASISLSRQESLEAATDSSSRGGGYEELAAQARKSAETRRDSRHRKGLGSSMHSSLNETDIIGENRDEARQDKHQQSAAERQTIRRRSSRSQPPPVARQPVQVNEANKVVINRKHLLDEHGADSKSRRAVSVSPSLASHVNIRHILENVAEVEGAFQEPQLAFKVAIEALDGPCWSTKVEGILALIRLATHHEQLVVGHLHEVVGRTAQETRNLRSTVARSAIFALGDFCAKLKRSVEPELEAMVQALMQKSTESTAFIRDDIRRALATMIEHITHWRLANALIYHGANHKNSLVRRMAGQYIALLVERMGAAKCLVGARDIGAQLLPVAARFAQDSSPHTRYYGRLILSKLVHHGAFERLLRKYLTPNLYRSTLGIIESVKRRGTGEPPPDG